MTVQDLAEATIIQNIPATLPGPLPEERTWAHFLAYTDSNGVLQRLRLGAAPLRIGRRAPCDIVLNDGEVSGEHCEVRMQGQDVFALDLGSTNGTFVNGRRAAPRLRLSGGALLQVGRTVLKLETRDSSELAESQELQRDLERARRYVRSLLPAPLRQGPIRVEWFFEPSAQVGGDGFGYYMLDERHVVGFIIDVSGHGVGAALHLVSVFNTLRQRALPDTDFHDPAQVLTRLNDMFQMDEHDGMLFTIWFGVLDLHTKVLRYASGGHHPGYLLPAGGGALRPLKTANPLLGALPSLTFHCQSEQLASGDKLYLFSDGVFEIDTAGGTPWSLEAFTALLSRYGAIALPQREGGWTEPERLFRQVRSLARPGPLDDDFSLLVATLT